MEGTRNTMASKALRALLAAILALSGGSFTPFIYQQF